MLTFRLILLILQTLVLVWGVYSCWRVFHSRMSDMTYKEQYVHIKAYWKDRLSRKHNVPPKD